MSKKQHTRAPKKVITQWGRNLPPEPELWVQKLITPPLLTRPLSLPL